MAASIIIEQEQGTYTRSLHRHNGYYAGDFSGRDDRRGAGPVSPRRPTSQDLAPTAARLRGTNVA